MPTEEEIIHEIVNDEKMHCAACNVTLYNESVWEVHKKGKKWGRMRLLRGRHLKQLKRAIEERKQHPGIPTNIENHLEGSNTQSSPSWLRTSV